MRSSDVRGIVVGLVAILFGQWILIEVIPLVWRGHRSESWPETTGTVGRVHESFVYYHYEIKGQMHYGAERVPAAEPAENDPIAVYFDPDAPSVSRIERGIDRRHVWCALFGAGIFVLGVIGCWFAIASHIGSRIARKSVPRSAIGEAVSPNEHIRVDRGGV